MGRCVREWLDGLVAVCDLVGSWVSTGVRARVCFNTCIIMCVMCVQAVCVCVCACVRVCACVCCNVPVFTSGISSNRRHSLLLRIDFSPICRGLIHTLFPVYSGKGRWVMIIRMKRATPGMNRPQWSLLLQWNLLLHHDTEVDIVASADVGLTALYVILGYKKLL